MQENALKRIARSRENSSKKRMVGNQKIKPIESMVNQKFIKSLMNLKTKLIKSLTNLKMKSMMKRVMMSSSMSRQREYKSYRRTVGKRHLSGLSPFITAEKVEKDPIVDRRRHFATKVELNMPARDEQLERRLRQLVKESLDRKKLLK